MRPAFFDHCLPAIIGQIFWSGVYFGGLCRVIYQIIMHLLFLIICYDIPSYVQQPKDLVFTPSRKCIVAFALS